ncbi:zinc finger domain-containing protein [Aliivibrio fischeri]
MEEEKIGQRNSFWCGKCQFLAEG